MSERHGALKEDELVLILGQQVTMRLSGIARVEKLKP